MGIAYSHESRRETMRSGERGVEEERRPIGHMRHKSGKEAMGWMEGYKPAKVKRRADRRWRGESPKQILFENAIMEPNTEHAN